jgi:hypothetical protein
MTRMNGTNLLAAGAALALALATGTAMAQQEHKNPAQAPSGTQQPPTAKRQNDEGQNKPAARSERPEGRTGEAQQSRSRPETTGQARPEEQPNQRKEQTSEPKRSETQRARPDTTGQARPEEQNQRKERMSEPKRGETDHEARPERNGEVPADHHSTVGQGAAGARVNITPDKRTRIHETIIHERNVPRVASVKFDISVGTRVPRDVRIAALPQTIVEIEPEWRGFEYFMVGDEIVVVDPTTMEIVAVINA